VRLFGIIPAVLIALLMGQVRPSPRPKRGAADAGERPILLGTDPPGRLRPPTSPSDAGADGGAADAGPDEVHRELQQLRTRLDLLEQDRAARAQQAVQQLQQLTQEVQQIRQQIADAEARRVAEEQDRQSRRAAVQSSVDALYVAQQRLMAGDSSIEAELDRAQATFTGQALRNLQAARAALQNRDLARARGFLAAAISEAQAGR
jgi:hypothetical protein